MRYFGSRKDFLLHEKQQCSPRGRSFATPRTEELPTDLPLCKPGKPDEQGQLPSPAPIVQVMPRGVDRLYATRPVVVETQANQKSPLANVSIRTTPGKLSNHRQGPPQARGFGCYPYSVATRLPVRGSNIRGLRAGDVEEPRGMLCARFVHVRRLSQQRAPIGTVGFQHLYGMFMAC